MNTFEEAQQTLMKERFMAPSYLIMSGIRTGQACIITRFSFHLMVNRLHSNLFISLTSSFLQLLLEIAGRLQIYSVPIHKVADGF